MKNLKNKVFATPVAIMVSSIIVLAASINTSAVSVKSLDEAKNGGPWEKLLYSAQMTAVTNTLHECMGDVSDTADLRSDGFQWLSKKKMGVFLWEEAIIGGKADDYQIYCDEKQGSNGDHAQAASNQGVLSLALSLYGYDSNYSFACGPGHDNKTGLLSAPNGTCKDAWNNWSEYKVRRNANWNANLKTMYNTAKTESGASSYMRTYEETIKSAAEGDLDAKHNYAMAYMNAEAVGCLADSKFTDKKTDVHTGEVKIISKNSDGTAYEFKTKYYDPSDTTYNVNHDVDVLDNKEYIGASSCYHRYTILNKYANDDWLKKLNEDWDAQQKAEKNQKAWGAYEKATSEEQDKAVAQKCPENTTLSKNQIFVSWNVEIEMPTSGNKTQSIFSQDITNRQPGRDFRDTAQGFPEALRTEAKTNCQTANPGKTCAPKDPPTFSNCASCSGDKTMTLNDLKAAGRCIEVTGETTSNILPTDPGQNPNEPSADCSQFTGALGWIVCPTTQSLAEGSDGLYGAVLEGLLDVPAELVSNDANESPAYIMWTYFRSIANVLLIIIILAVIFSQLTGVGIDNYGIKKMLPRIIVVAILINLSYFVCQLCVDLSNIIGNSLDTWLSSIAATVSSRLGVSFGEVMEVGFAKLLEWIFLALGGAAAVGGTVAPAIIAGISGAGASTVWILLIPLFLGILVAIVAILLFFVMLAARRLLVVICVAISPLAIICYVLPNTQKLFKKWFDIFKAMLFLYPICSALYGVSTLVKVIAFKSEGTHIWMVIAAMVGSYLPFLAAPALLKGALNAVGNLGAKLSGITAAARRGTASARSSLERSGTYQDATRQANIARNAKRVGKLTTERNGKRVPKEDLSARQQRMLARYMNQQKADEKEGMAEQAVLMNSLTNNGENEDILFSEYDKAMDSGNYSRARAIADIAGRRKDTAARFMAHNEKYEATAMARINSITDTAAKQKAQAAFSAGRAQINKQIATGDNSKNYRAADGVKFEYASQFNKGQTDQSFEEWRKDGANVDTAINHNITNINDLYGQQNKALEALIKDIPNMSDDSKGQLERILAARQNPNFSSPDNTKDTNIHNLEEALKSSRTAAATRQQAIDDAWEQHYFDT